MASTNAMGHHHEWQDRPPDGKIDLSKSWDEKYWDEEELAANFMYSSPEEISRLKNLLLNDPDFLTSTSWPYLTEWCSSCKSTRSVRLALPEEETETALEEEEELVGATVEKVCSAPTYQNACTQTPKPKPRRRGGRASRMRRLLPSKLCSVSNEVCPCPGFSATRRPTPGLREQTFCGCRRSLPRRF